MNADYTTGKDSAAAGPPSLSRNDSVEERVEPRKPSGFWRATSPPAQPERGTNFSVRPNFRRRSDYNSGKDPAAAGPPSLTLNSRNAMERKLELWTGTHPCRALPDAARLRAPSPRTGLIRRHGDSRVRLGRKKVISQKATKETKTGGQRKNAAMRHSQPDSVQSSSGRGARRRPARSAFVSFVLFCEQLLGYGCDRRSGGGIARPRPNPAPGRRHELP
jgi:hypothetical protein